MTPDGRTGIPVTNGLKKPTNSNKKKKKKSASRAESLSLTQIEQQTAKFKQILKILPKILSCLFSHKFKYNFFQISSFIKQLRDWF